MKEEFQKLRGIAKEVPEKIKDFNEAMQAFNDNVAKNSDLSKALILCRPKPDDYDVSRDGLDAFIQISKESYYDMASKFCTKHEELYSAAIMLAAEHPKYSDKSIRNNLIKAMVENGAEDPEMLEVYVDLYIALKNNGFFEAFDIELEILALEEDSGLLVVDMAEQVKQTAVDAGKAALESGKSLVSGVCNVARPYGDVAREQISHAGVKAMEKVGNGSKKLAKMFENLGNKPQNK